MKITWYGEQKVIEAFGCAFAYSEESHNAVVQVEWANRVLSEPSVIYPNCRDSHVVAGELLDKFEDVLLEFRLFSA